MKLMILSLLVTLSQYFEVNGKWHHRRWDVANTNKRFITDRVVDCDKFFHGKPWPAMKKSTGRGIVKLCQTDSYNNSNMSKPFFATAFSTSERIPVYTANAVILHANATEYPRPDEKYWERLAFGLCDISQLPAMPIDSNVEFIRRSEMHSCRRLQASVSDYRDNGMHIDRGHLSPNAINSRNNLKQIATFTLTNAAPQFAEFNRYAWRVYECVTENMILDLVPGETVYVITGTFGTALDKHGKPLWMNGNMSSDSTKNPIKVPRYYWKAVCYPGNKHTKKEAWGYAIVKSNVNVITRADYESYVTLKQFSQNYFREAPFGSECMNASFGYFSKVFSVWDKYIEERCKAPF